MAWMAWMAWVGQNDGDRWGRVQTSLSRRCCPQCCPSVVQHEDVNGSVGEHYQIRVSIHVDVGGIQLLDSNPGPSPDQCPDSELSKYT